MAILSNSKERFSAALFHASRAWRMALDRRLRHLGLSQAGWTTIALAAKSSELLSQSDLAQRVGVEQATMVVTIDKLVKAGLVARQALATDRRVKLIAVTGPGMVLYHEVRAEAELFREEMLAG